MRYIPKSLEPPASIRAWRSVQESVGVNLDYNSFSRKPQLWSELIEEPFGLCAHTGAPIDNRLGGHSDSNFAFQAPIEHVKPRSICEQELIARGGEYGRAICADMDHNNLVAALEVRRKSAASAEIFGAASHGNEMLPITPLQPECEEKFIFTGTGDINGVDDAARTTIQLLKLDHKTLTGWRRAAIAAFFPVDLRLTREDVECLVERLGTPFDGKLPEFSFCVLSYAKSLIGEALTD